jgi:hypothetical protein
MCQSAKCLYLFIEKTHVTKFHIMTYSRWPIRYRWLVHVPLNLRVQIQNPQ